MKRVSLSVAILLLQGCGTGGIAGPTVGQPAVTGTNNVVDASVVSSNTVPSAATLDSMTGRCSAGSIQLLSADELRSATDSWSEQPRGAECTDVAKAKMPDKADYPTVLASAGVPGAAQVLVRVERDGSAASAVPVCATDSAFADVAVKTAMAIEYTPTTCNGEPARATILLPLSYTP